MSDYAGQAFQVCEYDFPYKTPQAVTLENETDWNEVFEKFPLWEMHDEALLAVFPCDCCVNFHAVFEMFPNKMQIMCVSIEASTLIDVS